MSYTIGRIPPENPDACCVSCGYPFDVGDRAIGDEHCAEWGYFSLAELASVRVRFGLGIERDLYFPARPISEVCPDAYHRIRSALSAP